MTTALITGIAGQDGVLLARELRARGVDVVGTVRPDETPGTAAIVSVYLGDVTVLEHDVCDGAAFAQLLEKHRPTEI